MDAIVAPEKIEFKAFDGEVETRFINNNMENDNLHNSDFLVKKIEEHESKEEFNIDILEDGT